MYIGFDFDKVDHPGRSFTRFRKDCLSCGRSYTGHFKTKFCWSCSTLRSTADSQKYRASKLGLTEHFGIFEWIQLCQKYGCKCLRCEQITNLVPDHVMPLSAGGKNTIDNIQPLCGRCNFVKGSGWRDYRS